MWRFTSTGWVEFHSSVDLNVASMYDMFSAAAAAATATATTTAAVGTAATVAVVSAATAAAIAGESNCPFDVVNRLSDDPFGDNDPAVTDILNLDDYPEGSYVVTDWKGEPMVITPGD